MNLNQFTQLFPNAKSAYFDALDTFIWKYNIDNLVMFLSQVSEETGRFTQFIENMNYSAARLIAVWPNHFNKQNASLYAYQPIKLANFIYANRMGNGNIASGDGWKFRGRGGIQVTGRNLYQKFADDIGSDINSVTSYMETPDGAIESACWYWTYVAWVDGYTNRTDVPTVTQIINGGLVNLQTRYNEFDRISKVLTIA